QFERADREIIQLMQEAEQNNALYENAQYNSHRDSVNKSLDYHREVLLKLGYFEHVEFPVRNIVLTGDVRQAFIDLIQQTKSNTYWELYPSSNGTSVEITCPATEKENWRKFVSDYDHQAHA